MGRALDVQLRVIPARVANPFVDAYHYSGKHVNNSQLHLGAFLDGRLHGVMSFGPPMDRSHVLGLVEGTPWDGMIELNRMAFDEMLPRNSESRCIGVAMRMLRRNAPQVKWVLGYADACSCGDGAIYRASDFVLTGIKRNASVARLPNGEELVDLAFRVTRTKKRPELGGLSAQEYFGTSTPNFHEYVRLMGGARAGGLPAPVRLLPRQELEGEAHRPGAAILGDSGGGGYNVQGHSRRWCSGQHARRPAGRRRFDSDRTAPCPGGLR